MCVCEEERNANLAEDFEAALAHVPKLGDGGPAVYPQLQFSSSPSPHLFIPPPIFQMLLDLNTGQLERAGQHMLNV